MMPDTTHHIELIGFFISPGHNFFGHHEKPPGRNPVVEVDQIECIAGMGISGDRFFDYKENYKGQITFFAFEVYERMCTELVVNNVCPSAMRRNVITRGIDLNGLIGEEFEIQGVLFEGVQECRPCYWMNRAVAAGAEEFLRGNGGLRARILSDGLLKRGDAKLTVIEGGIRQSGRAECGKNEQ